MKDRRLRFTWTSNSTFTPSGYGVHQKDLLYRLLKDGWPMAQITFTGLEAACITLDGLLHYPKMVDPFGSDAMYYHSKHFNANVAFVMQDIWTLSPQFLQQMIGEGIKFIPYVPIDKEPVPPGVLDKLRFAYKIITFSEYGQKALLRAGFSSTLIKESTDTNLLKPIDKEQCRREAGLPQGKFVVGMIGANKPDAIPRKGWQEALEAFAIFHKTHPDSIFYCGSNQPGGFPIPQFAKYLGILDSLFQPNEYQFIFHSSREMVNKMINTFDVLIHPSTTEGFGLGVIEAQSAGVPVIVNNCTAMPEMVIDGVTGEICKTQKQVFASDGGIIHIADVPSLAEKLEKVFQADRIKMGNAAREHVVKNYNIDTSVKEKWIPFLESLQSELLPPLVDKTEVKV